MPRRRGFRAPGRVNLMGDHTDYNGGFVLPLAIDLQCEIRFAPNGDGAVRVRSDLDGALVEVAADGSTDPAAVSPPWGRYVAGVVAVLAARGRRPVGVDARVASTIPAGAGLSSSAALEVAVALALCDAAGLALDRLALALACQEAELLATGVPCGVMDQLASVAGAAGRALLVDCRSYELTPVALPDDLAVLVVHSGLSRSLDGSPYADRRAACERAAAELGLASLRDATAEQVRDDPRARHVVAENARTQALARALAAGDRERIRDLFRASHASLRDDFEVSTPELDALVTALEEAGAVGARLTGAGFGGCAVALVDRAEAGRVAERATRLYRARTRLDPSAFVVRAADGAGPLRDAAPLVP